MNDQDNSLFSYRVVGFGDKSRITIDQINSLGYPGVKAIQYTNQAVIPEEEDKMVILLNPSDKETHSLSKSFFPSRSIDTNNLNRLY